MPRAARASSDDVESLVREVELASRIGGWACAVSPRHCCANKPAVDAAATGRGRVRFERLSAVVRYVTIETDGGERHALAGNGSAAMRGGETGAFPVARSRKPTGLRAWEGGEGPWHAFAFHASVHVAPGYTGRFHIDTDVSIRSTWPPSPLPRVPSSGTGPECPLR